MSYKQIKVPEELHWELKKTAAVEKTTLVKLLWEFIRYKNGENKLRKN